MKATFPIFGRVCVHVKIHGDTNNTRRYTLKLLYFKIQVFKNKAILVCVVIKLNLGYRNLIYVLFTIRTWQRLESGFKIDGIPPLVKTWCSCRARTNLLALA